MIDIVAVEIVTNRFNTALDDAKNSDNFDECISLLNRSRECIDALEHFVRQMKQEEHDLTQDMHNKFKNKGYSHNVKF